MSAVLETRSLSKYFGAVVAAKDINISFKSGERVGVIGANGAGKTTFINLVTGYLKPSRGRIFYQGRNITALSPRTITNLGICRSFQIPQLFPELSVSDNLLVALGFSAKAKSSFFRPLLNKRNFEQVKQISESFDLQNDLKVQAGALPQGKRKLLDIAMATVNDPNLILLDEPTSGVSAEEKFAVMEQLMETLDTTILLIEHDMEVVERFCNRAIAFYGGRVIADGSVKNVLTDEQVKQYIVGKELHRKDEKGESDQNQLKNISWDSDSQYDDDQDGDSQDDGNQDNDSQNDESEEA